MKLTSYFGERHRSGGAFVADALLDLYGRHEIAASILLRGTEGFGLKHHLRTDRSLTLSEDLPLVAVAVDTRPRIEAVLGPARALNPAGLVTVEGARLLADTAVAGEEPLDLRAQPRGVLGHLVAVQQLALARLARRVADHAGRAAHQRDHLVAGAAQVGHQHQRHQVAGVQAGRRRIGADVHRQRRGQDLGEVLGRRLLNQTAPGKLFECAHVHVHVKTAPYLPRSAGNTQRSAVTSRAWPRPPRPRSPPPTASTRWSRPPRRASRAFAAARHRRARAAFASRSPAARRRARSTRTWSTRIDWTRTDVFFGDERAVPPDDPQSNYRMARETLLDPARVPPANVFRWRAEDPPISTARRATTSRPCARGGSPPWLDLALLGLGPDGHTASLFPGTAALAEEDRLAVAVDVPALGTRRLTLTYPAFCGRCARCSSW